MPMYEYKCADCGATAEYIQKFSDPPMTECEVCEGRLEKALSAPSFHLKGGGWYADGYATKGKSKDGGTSKGKDASASSDTKKGSSSSDGATDKKKKGSGKKAS